MRQTRILLILIGVVSCLTGRPVAAVDLQTPTVQAYEMYAERATQAFLARIENKSAVTRNGRRESFARAGGEDGIVDVAGGLLHHWIGATFIAGVPLHRVLDVSRDYPAYTRIYKSIVNSRVLNRDGNQYRVLMRLREGEAGITAVLDVESTVRYYFPSPQIAYAISTSNEIREIENAGGRDEQRLEPGHDSGYLWRASTLTCFREEEGGVYVEMETLGLSRRFPPMLGWIIEPIARRLGRKSVERTLQEFVEAVRSSQ